MQQSGQSKQGNRCPECNTITYCKCWVKQMLFVRICRAIAQICPSNSIHCPTTMGVSAIMSLCASCCIPDSLDLEIEVVICFPALFISSLQDGTCMSAGLKTPKRYQLFISNTTFRNFDAITCTAIRTCSGCYQGQGESDLLWFSRVSTVFGFPHFRFRCSGVHSFHRQPLKDVSVESLEKHCIGMRSTGPSFASVILSLCLHQELGFEVFAYLLCLGFTALNGFQKCHYLCFTSSAGTEG